MRVNGEIVFGATVAEPLHIIEEVKHDIMRFRKDKIAQDLGIKIAEEKGWTEFVRDDMQFAELRLYVFTPTELMDFMHAKFKAKLQKMAVEEDYLTDHQREALIIQSERF